MLEHYEAASMSEMSAKNGMGKDDDPDQFYISDHDKDDDSLPLEGYGKLMQKAAEKLNV